MVQPANATGKLPTVLVIHENRGLNPHIEDILRMLSAYKYNGRPISCECQSGFDGRILEKNPELALLLKKAHFKNIRVAWDFSFEQHEQVERWIHILENAGFNRRAMFVFMVYNWNFDYEELENKRKKCFEWGIQIADCRYRPLDQTYDNYNSYCKRQNEEDYYIHSNWSDFLIRKFRSDVRKHNVCLRYKIDWNNYEKRLERINSKKTLPKTVVAIN